MPDEPRGIQQQLIRSEVDLFVIEEIAFIWDPDASEGIGSHQHGAPIYPIGVVNDVSAALGLIDRGQSGERYHCAIDR